MGIPVYIVENNLDTPAFFSRYCSGRFRFGSDLTEKYLVDLLNVGLKIGRKAVLIPTDDETCIFVAKNAQRLKERFIFPNVTTDLACSLTSKRELYSLAKAHGVPTAEISFPQSRKDITDFIGKSTFPIVAKAIHGWQWKGHGGKTLIINTPRELFEIYNVAHPNLILQEYIPGGDGADWMFDGYFDKKSKCLFGYTGRKLRQWPLRGGVTTLGLCSRNETLEHTAKQFMAAIRYSGVVDMDFRFDARDKQYKLLDVNPRIGSTFRLFVSNNGNDVSRALYNDLTGRHISSDAVYDGRKWVVENFDFLAILASMKRRELTLERLRKSFVGLQETAYLASDDPLPCLGAFNRSFASAAISSILYHG
jgi:predicted ATP-grasp superfamily ATP-dependent carboligase